jgi:hypothetical protein
MSTSSDKTSILCVETCRSSRPSRLNFSVFARSRSSFYDFSSPFRSSNVLFNALPGNKTALPPAFHGLTGYYLRIPINGALDDKKLFMRLKLSAPSLDRQSFRILMALSFLVLSIRGSNFPITLRDRLEVERISTESSSCSFVLEPRTEQTKRALDY